MNASMIAGAVLTGLVVIWLMVLVSVTVMRTEPIHIPAGQYNIIRFLCTIAAACGGWLLSGDLAVRVSGEIETNLKLVASGTGAAALALLVWLTFPKPAGPTVGTSHLKAEIPSNWTVHQAATFLAGKFGATLSTAGFTAQDLATPIGRSVSVTAKDGLTALLQLRKYLPFEVSFDPVLNDYKISRV